MVSKEVWFPGEKNKLLYRMPCCRVCGEHKPDEEFHHVINFTKYKKHKVTWCRPCQKLWIDMKKEKDRMHKLHSIEKNWEVSFD